MLLKLETERLLLRPFEKSDAQAMYDNWASDEEVTKYLTWNAHTNIEETKFILNLWIEEYQKPERINCGIVLKETNELIGGIDVVGYIEGVPVIGYCISRKHWNKGIMSEALKELTNYLFSIGHTKIRVDAMVDNIGSNRVIQKCGGEYINTYDDFIKAKQRSDKINSYLIYKK